jgi:hypothetical protein
LRGGLAGLGLLLAANVFDLLGRCSAGRLQTSHAVAQLVGQALVCCALAFLLACLVKVLLFQAKKPTRRQGLPPLLPARDFQMAPHLERN